jgi:hypothetical protein
VTCSAEALQLSRLAFIRQSIMRNVAAFHHNEKPTIDGLFGSHKRRSSGPWDAV